MIHLSPGTTIRALIRSNRRQAIFTSSFCIHISYSVVSVVMYIADKSFQICLHFTLFNTDAISIHVFYLSFYTNTCASTVIIHPSFTDLCVMHLLCQRLFEIRPRLVNSEKKSPRGSFEKYAGFRYMKLRSNGILYSVWSSAQMWGPICWTPLAATWVEADGERREKR